MTKSLRILVATLAFAGISNIATAADENEGHQPIMVAFGFLDQLTNRLTNAAINRAEEEADAAIDRAINEAPPTAAGVPRVRPASNPQVREIQQRLAQIGYSPGPADGIMGQKTGMAIYAYQQSIGLPADGSPSGQVLDTLRSQTGYMGQTPRTPANIQPTPQQAAPKQFWSTVSSNPQAASSAPPAANPTQRPLSAKEISSVQQYLADMGYAPGRTDGMVDKRTESAIYAFQREYGLQADGKPSLEVLMSLRANAVSTGQLPPPEPIEVPMASNLRRSEKTLWYECERELNEDRKGEGIAEIKLITPDQARQAAQAEQTMMVAQVSQGMMAYEPEGVALAKMLKKAGTAPNPASMQVEIRAQNDALVEVMGCVATKLKEAN